MGEELRDELSAVGFKELSVGGGAGIGFCFGGLGDEAQEGVAEGYADGGGTGIVVRHRMAHQAHHLL